MAIINTKAFIQDQNTFVMNLMALLPTSKVIVCNMAALFVGLVDGIASIVVQYTCNNNVSNKDILKVVPHIVYAL